MTAKEVIREAKSRGCTVTEGKKHTKLAHGTCRTTVPRHKGDLGTGLLRSIQRAMEPALGPNWLLPAP